MEKATELEYLRWFHANVFGNDPLDDAWDDMQRQFAKQTGKAVPDEYTPDES